MRTITNRAGWVLAAITSLTVLAALAGVVRGGPLDPPGPTSSTSGVLEPGTPITGIPYTINDAGYYYLTGNLTATTLDQDGILINHDYVTLDLKGFTLTGYTKTGTGIAAAANTKNIVIRDGFVASWDTGVSATAAISLEVSGLSVTSSALGMYLLDSTLEDCRVKSNDFGVVAIESVIRRCAFERNDGNALSLGASSVVEDNVFEANAGSYNIQIAGVGNVLRRNTARATQAVPFVVLLSGVSGNLLTGNRYPCSPGIVDNSGQFNYIPGGASLEGSNFCF